jgi:hypothetical protein
MATNVKPTTKICYICKRTGWLMLPPEDGPGVAHHASYAALEQSAKTCDVCPLILKAAISYHSKHGSSRFGKGFWREYSTRDYPKGQSFVRVTRIKSFGACLPAQKSTIQSNLPGAVIAPTGTIRMEGDHIDDGLPDLDDLSLKDVPSDMPVWLYGNWWSDGAASDRDSFRIMGIGARFGKSSSPLDAFGTKDGELHLRGSPIRICKDDGKVPPDCALPPPSFSNATAGADRYFWQGAFSPKCKVDCAR